MNSLYYIVYILLVLLSLYLLLFKDTNWVIFSTVIFCSLIIGFLIRYLSQKVKTDKILNTNELNPARIKQYTIQIITQLHDKKINNLEARKALDTLKLFIQDEQKAISMLSKEKLDLNKLFIDNLPSVERYCHRAISACIDDNLEEVKNALRIIDKMIHIS